MDIWYVDFHHGGEFDDKGTYVGGEVWSWMCDGDIWSYFEILGIVKETGYPGVLEIWYDFASKLKLLENGFGTIELLNWFKTNGKVDLYIIHSIS